MMALIAEAHDTHANLWSSLQVRPPTGACRLPVNVRFIPDSGGKNQAVVTSFASPRAEKPAASSPATSSNRWMERRSTP